MSEIRRGTTCKDGENINNLDEANYVQRRWGGGTLYNENKNSRNKAQRFNSSLNNDDGAIKTEHRKEYPEDLSHGY